MVPDMQLPRWQKYALVLLALAIVIIGGVSMMMGVDAYTDEVYPRTLWSHKITADVTLYKIEPSREWHCYVVVGAGPNINTGIVRRTSSNVAVNCK